MVSNVFGELKKSTKESDIIKAIFPGGSVTGAPKEKSMAIIDSLEKYQRDVYTGAIGFINSNGALPLFNKRCMLGSTKLYVMTS